ncbi:Tyrosyl-DNA phosphodiesterase [Penicillium brevicompactum]|uniref:Tyrosyl-DNA phosphodiesterase n=1 Tax=Penicillium brevicompactum TaxID=5074 RepID=A0A9W9QQN5_PENBR|nr:Tyrosyl-DNA phosphodiesterase [Penicillium brevicompactum]
MEDPEDMDDPDFRAAIQASLRECGMSPSNTATPAPPGAVVDLTNDSDSDIQEVFPKSRSVVSSSSDTATAADNAYDEDELQRHSPKPQTSPPPASSAGLSGLDRKKMEQERLARLASRKVENKESSSSAQLKRKAEQSPDASAQSARTKPKIEPASPAPQSSTIMPEVVDLESLALNPTSTPVHQVGEQAAPVASLKPAASSSNATVGRPPTAQPAQTVCRRYDSNAPDVKFRPTARPHAQWPLGTIKKTHIAGYPRVGNEITIEEVIQRGDLELGVFSGFMWDMEWFFKKLNTSSTRFILIMQAKDQETKDEYLRDIAGVPNLRLCFPPMDPMVYCMHSKLMLLFHKDYLRIAIPTANPTSTDWGENGLMENSVFLIDLPKLKGTSDGAHDTQFYKELVYFLTASNLNDKIIERFKEFDFTETKRYAFVHSIGGSNTGESWKRTGYAGLGRALGTLGLTTDSKVNIDYVTSSMGSLTKQFLRALYLACKGEDGLRNYNLRVGTKNDQERQRTVDTIENEMMARFRVYFPSDQTAREAHERPNYTAGTICFNPKWWHDRDFPREVLRDCQSDRGVLMHNKLAFVRPDKPISVDDTTECSAWAYVGSANLSESAWGRIVKDPKNKQLKINCRNWECGVIVPILTEKNLTQQPSEREATSLSPERFQNIVPVPMRLPAPSLSDTRKPFFFGL